MCRLYRKCAFFFFKQKTAYEMRISDWSSDVCSSDLRTGVDAIDQAITFHPQQVATKGFEQAIQLRESRDIGPQDLQGDVRRGAWRNHIAWRQEIGRASCRERGCQYV